MLELFWSVFSLIQTEYRNLENKSPYLVRRREGTDTFTKFYTYIHSYIHYTYVPSFHDPTKQATKICLSHNRVSVSHYPLSSTVFYV